MIKDPFVDAMRPVREADNLIGNISRKALVGEDDTIELVYDRIHQLVEADDYDTIDRFLAKLTVDDHLNSVLLSVLTATAMSEVRAQLPSRATFVARTYDCLVRREGEQAAKELISGLG